MTGELSNLHKKAIGITLKVQQISFVVAALAIVASILIVNLMTPSITSALVLFLCLTFAYIGTITLLQTWWYTSIRRLIISPAEWYRLVGYSVFVSCITWSVFFLWQANLLGVTSSLFVFALIFVYHRYNRMWAKTQSEAKSQLVNRKK